MVIDKSVDWKYYYFHNMKSVISEHWTKGGTGVTNFDKKDRHIYEAAIKEYGNPCLLIVDKPHPGPGGYYDKRMEKTLHSLHFVGQAGEARTDLSDFWRVFEKIKYGQTVL